jgi:hypothetical protein
LLESDASGLLCGAKWLEIHRRFVGSIILVSEAPDSNIRRGEGIKSGFTWLKIGTNDGLL